MKKWQPYNPTAERDRRITIITWVVLGIALVAVLWAAAAHGQALVCDPQVGVQRYRVTFIAVNGQSSDVVEESDALVDTTMRHDISLWPFGTIEAQVQAGGYYVLDGQPQDVWRWSDPDPFELIIPGPNQVTGKQLEE